MRFLHAADLHLDSPLRGLARRDDAPHARLRGATRSAVAKLVDFALTNGVDFLLLCGDLFDGDWPDFHTGLYFREQMARLARADVPVFIVNGNHDAASVITRHLALPPNVTVFESRRAHTVEIERLGVALHGRSFGTRHTDEDLVPSYPPPVPGRFNIGLLHTSLNGRPPHDPYAPTTRATLVAQGYDYWALGHVHTREVVSESPRIVYPGNLQGRWASESGPKGCELVDVDEDHRIRTEFIALDTVRWHDLRIDVTVLSDAGALERALGDVLAAACADDAERLHAVRVTLAGASDLHPLEAAEPGRLDATVRSAAQDQAGVDLWIEQVRLEIDPPPRASGLAATILERDDAVGELAVLAAEFRADPGRLGALTEALAAPLLDRLPADVRARIAASLPTDPDTHRRLVDDALATALAVLDSGRA
ncbi:MAG: DNA repair exonuclease [Burkholderiaceae bacterium]